MEGLNRFLERLAQLTSWVALAFLLFMMLAITTDVIARATVGQAVLGLFEMSEMSMVMVVFMGLGAALIDDAHIRVTMLTDALPTGAGRACTALAWCLAALAFVLLAWPATKEAAYSFSIREFRWGYFQMPIWWAKIAVAVGLWFAAVQAFVHASFILTGRIKPVPEAKTTPH